VPAPCADRPALLRLTVADNSPRIAPDRRVVDVLELRRFVAGRHWRRPALAGAHIDAENPPAWAALVAARAFTSTRRPNVVPVVDRQTGLASWLPRRGVGRSAIVISRWAPPAGSTTRGGAGRASARRANRGHSRRRPSPHAGSEHQLAATSRPFGSSQPQVLRSEYAICRGRWMVGSSGSVVSYVLAAGCSKLVNSVWPRSLSVSSRSTGWPTPVIRSVPWAARWWACTRAPRQEQSRKVRRRGPVAGGRVRTRTADSGRRVVDQLRRGPARRRRGWCSVAALDRAITPATSTGRCLPTAPAPGSSQLVRHGDAPAQR
jgi:hypothetical protein